MSVSKTFIGGAICQEFEWEAPTAEKNVRLSRMQRRTVLFSLQMCLEGGDGSGTFRRRR